jgi:hypothetical protein
MFFAEGAVDLVIDSAALISDAADFLGDSWLSTWNDAVLNALTIAAAGLVRLTASAWLI